MRIVVCLKQVPENAGYDRTKNTVVRDGVRLITNPADVFALEAALDVRQRLGGVVKALSMGSPDATQVLLAAGRLGADRLFLADDPAFAGSDALATATVLAAAIRFTGGADLILCGARTIDGATAQVGPGIAALLGVPCAADITGITAVTETHIDCTRRLEDRRDFLRAPLPCLLTCREWMDGVSHPWTPSIARLRRAKGIPVIHLDRGALHIDACGQEGSPTRVLDTSAVERPVRACAMHTDAAPGAAEIVRRIRHVIESRVS